MICSNCGTENPDYGVYCFQCGKPLQEKIEPPQVPTTTQTAAPYSTTTPLPRGNGVLILILGISSLVVCMPLGIIAWIMGNNELQKMNAGLISRQEEGITQAGKILGIISTLLFLLIIGTIMIVFFFMFRFGSMPPWDLQF